MDFIFSNKHRSSDVGIVFCEMKFVNVFIELIVMILGKYYTFNSIDVGYGQDCQINAGLRKKKSKMILSATSIVGMNIRNFRQMCNVS